MMSPEYVQVQVEDHLVRVRPRINDQPITAVGDAFLVGDRFDNGQHVAQQLLILFRDLVG